MISHFPKLFHQRCIRCTLMHYLMHDHGYAGKGEVTREELLEVLYGERDILKS